MSLLLSGLPDVLAFAARTDDAGPEPSRARMSPSAPPPDERARDDARLLRRMAVRDKAAFAELYDRFARPLHATALRIVADRAEAQDIVHDAFLTLWDKAAEFDGARGSAFAWAVTLVRNRAIDRVRSRKRRHALLAASAPADLGYEENATAAGESAAAGDEARAVRAAVATLPLEQQRALELAFFSGFTQRQIAEKLAEPLGTVKARIRRGLLKLRDALPRRL
jgi:RNA polymerase sigma-70 factor (ECF subfamily)